MEFSASFEKLYVPAGFLFGAATAGIKESGKPDMACIIAPPRSKAAAVFTTNRVVAAPVTVGRSHVTAMAHDFRAVIINSGNANCATGHEGVRAAKSVCAAASQILKTRITQILPSSTGIIGVPLPKQKLIDCVPQLLASARPDAVESFARAIMTTDTRPKVASAQITIGDKPIRVLGVAKGAGMIHPNMATMLVYIVTDVDLPPRRLRTTLRTAVDRTLNCLSIDGDTSTNDTAVLLASRASGVSRGFGEKFDEAVFEVCRSLARQIVSDGEGVRHVVTLKVTGTLNDLNARRIAESIATSPLVKTAWAGADPNWGRILCAAGYSGVPFDPAVVSIRIGPHLVCERGRAAKYDPVAVHEVLKQPAYEIHVSVGNRAGAVEYLTCDLTDEYVHINADYST
jgi:glutamate N-acetyltransferase / amino-acid N-acetyltransferase